MNVRINVCTYKRMNEGMYYKEIAVVRCLSLFCCVTFMLLKVVLIMLQI